MSGKRRVLIGTLKMARFSTLPLDLGTFWLGCCLGANGWLANIDFAFATTTLIMGRWSVLIFDDISDYKADQINAPERPLPSNMLSRNQANIIGLVFALISLLTALAVSLKFISLIILLLAVAKLGTEFLAWLGFPSVLMLSGPLIFSTFPLVGWSLFAPLDNLAVLLFLTFLSWDIAHDVVGILRDWKGDSMKLEGRAVVAFGKDVITLFGGLMFVIHGFLIVTMLFKAYLNLAAVTAVIVNIVMIIISIAWDMEKCNRAAAFRRYWELSCSISTWVALGTLYSK